ncbi:MAG: amidohydrolase family protein [Caldicoprobacterales bacterium]|jgi:predicted TIM-barrel fold metal-dependent hydrolase
MIYDCHIHMMREENQHIASKDEMLEHGIGGGLLISCPPDSFSIFYGDAFPAEKRLDMLLEAVNRVPILYPLFWIDPTEKDCIKQAEAAIRMGVDGFKVICTHFYPGDVRMIEFAKFCAENNKPIFFHSGILYDGKVSSKYNRPVGFEDLISVNGLRFSLAHISWPWCDECIALFGKIRNASSRNEDFKVDMYIDITRGTPPAYRRDALYKLFSFTGFDTTKVMFGSDSRYNDYVPERVIKGHVEIDDEIMRDFGMNDEQRENIFKNNLLRFIGKMD